MSASAAIIADTTHALRGMATQSARAPVVACSECGAALPTPNASGCCSAKHRAAKSRRLKREACQVALAEITAALNKLTKALE